MAVKDTSFVYVKVMVLFSVHVNIWINLLVLGV